MNDKKLNLRRDLLGVVLFAAGAFLSVVVARCYWVGAAATDYAGVTVVDKELLRWLGRPACLVLGLVACTLGYRMFLLGQARNLLRSLLIGGVCLALGTSILMGALNPDYGGIFGQLIGTWASANLSKFVGIPLGLLCVFVPVWFAWLRPGSDEDQKAVRELAPLADRSTEASSGVTAEEAAELIPRRPRPVVLSESAAATRPLDPQLKAPVPAGAKALDATDVPTQPAHSTQAPAVSERVAAGLPLLGVRPGEDLARATPPEEPAGKRSVVVRPVDELEEVGPAIPLTGAIAATPPATVQAPTPAPLQVAAPEAAKLEVAKPAPMSAPAVHEPRPLAQPLAAGPLAPPSWEQPAETIDDLPVDAYGTPLSLVDELRRDSTVRAASAKEDALEEAAREAGVDDEELDAVLAGEETPRFEVAAAAAVEDDDEADVEDEEELVAERFELAVVVDDDEEEEEEADEEEAEETDAEAETPVAAVKVAAPALFDDPELEEELTAASNAATKVVEAESEATDDDEEPEDSEAEADEDEAANEAEDDPDEALRREAPLFAAPRALKDDSDESRSAEESEDDLPADETEDDEAPVAATPEREVVLRPQPARGEAVEAPVAPADVTAADATQGDLTDEDELVFKAGVLFLERQRVAVSMLQREFSLDFEQATHVLDRLQAAGLIGPYLGGQRRDILLTLDQWRIRAVAR